LTILINHVKIYLGYTKEGGKQLQRVANNAKLFCQAMTLRLVRAALAQLSDTALTEVQLACLRFVRLHPDPSVGAIADGLGVSDAAAAKLIDRLVKRNLLRREEHNIDRRVLKIKLTGEGKKLIQQVDDFEEHEFQTIIARMKPAELKALQDGLSAFIKAALRSPEEIEKACLRCGVAHFSDCPGNLLYKELTGRDRTGV
jgi:MarR family transcriptional regulator, organic hydroperoxide resistance regulator